MTEIELARAALNEAATYYAADSAWEIINHWVAVAQVHATLALAEREAGE